MARQETMCHGVPDSVVRWLKNGSKWLRAADLRERQKRRKVLKKELLVMVDAKRVPADVLPLVLRYVGYDHVGDDATPDSRHALLKQWVEAQIPPPAFANLEPWKRDALLRWILF
mmetsp:Transcript_29915/g.92455  ORF Transcript_29915/g.92455 Transcript_29915/m.92455 type:complete len:115 (+) Transcript_29915:68-412(+)